MTIFGINDTKRKRDDSSDLGSTSGQPIEVEEGEAEANNPIDFIKGKHLSEHPKHLQPQLFRKKISGNIIMEKHVKSNEFNGYMVQESFAKLHWKNVLYLKANYIYKDVVVEWMSTLSRTDDSLTGTIRGRTFTITPELIREHFMVDGSSQEYVRLNEIDAFHSKLYGDALRVVLGSDVGSVKKKEYLMSTSLTPLAKILWRIVVRNINPRYGPLKWVKMKEIFVLYALLTGTPRYSFALIVIDNLWEMFECKEKVSIPHACVVSELLRRLGAVSVYDEKIVVHENHHLITRKSVQELEFTENEDETQIYDQITKERVSFAKAVTREVDDVIPPETTVEISAQPPQHHQHQQREAASGFDVSSLMAGFEGVVSKAIQNVRSDVNTWRKESNHHYTKYQEQLAESKLEIGRLRDEVAKARAENRATLWAIERDRYYYEQESEGLRNYFATIHQPKLIARTGYVSQDAIPIHYPPVQRISRFLPQQYDAAGSNDDVPQKFRPFFHDVFANPT